MKLIGIRNLKIWYKILIIFQFMLIPVILIFVVLLVITHKMQDLHGDILLKNLTSITAAYNVENSLLNLKELKTNYILDGDRKWLSRFDEKVEIFNYWYNKAFYVANTEEEKDLLSVVSVEFSNYMKIHREIIYFADNGQKEKALNLLLTRSMKYYNVIYRGCEDLISINRGAISGSEDKLMRYIRNSRYLAYVIILCFVLLGILLVIMITKSIVDPIREIEKASNNMMPLYTSKVEMESLRERFQVMLDTLTINQQKMIVSERRAAIGEIAAGISHELNNPIGVICGFSEFLMKKKKLTDNDIEYIEDIYGEAVRCKKLLGELLDFARTPEPVYLRNDLSAVINETIKLLKNQERFSDIVFDTSVPAGGEEIEIDAVQIKQVLLNILLNACEAMSWRGTIAITLQYPEQHAEVIIMDTGPGIHDEEIKKIFTPFYTTRPKGIGLGLAICRDIVEKHNGRIEVGGAVGIGAEFIIKIPKVRDEKV